MAPPRLESFKKTTNKILLSIQDDEKLACSACGEYIVDGSDMWVFVLESGDSDTCCLPCAAKSNDVQEPFEEDTE